MSKRPRCSPAKDSSTTKACGRVLLVDDNSRDMNFYSKVLRWQGYDVHGVATFVEGMARLDRERYDLVIVSQGSCSFEGRGVLARALEHDRRTPVLVITASADMPAYIEAMQLGAFDYVEKPLAPSELLELVAKHLRPRQSEGLAA